MTVDKLVNLHLLHGKNVSTNTIYMPKIDNFQNRNCVINNNGANAYMNKGLSTNHKKKPQLK